MLVNIFTLSQKTNWLVFGHVYCVIVKIICISGDDYKMAAKDVASRIPTEPDILYNQAGGLESLKVETVSEWWHRAACRCMYSTWVPLAVLPG